MMYRVLLLLLLALPAQAQFLPYAGAGRGNGSPCLDTVVAPYHLAASKVGLMIADYDGRQVRFCGVTGIMRLLSAVSERPLGIARDDVSGTTYASMLGGALVAIDPSGHQQPITVPGLTTPYGLVVGDSALWIADRDGNAIWRLPLPAGSAPAVKVLDSEWVRGPQGVAWKDGALYVTDTNGCRILRRDAAGAVSLVAGTACGYGGDGGPAAAAQLAYPVAVAVSSDGSVLIADNSNHRIRRVFPNGVITTVVGTGAINSDHRRPAATDVPTQFPVTGPNGVAVGFTQLPGQVVAQEVLWYGSAADAAINVLVLPPQPPPATATSAPLPTCVPGCR